MIFPILADIISNLSATDLLYVEKGKVENGQAIRPFITRLCCITLIDDFVFGRLETISTTY